MLMKHSCADVNNQCCLSMVDGHGRINLVESWLKLATTDGSAPAAWQHAAMAASGLPLYVCAECVLSLLLCAHCARCSRGAML
jgi:hypothetical protein